MSTFVNLSLLLCIFLFHQITRRENETDRAPWKLGLTSSVNGLTNFVSQLRLQNINVIIHQSTLLLHVVGMEGMGEIIRVHDKRALVEWADIFSGEFTYVQFSHTRD